MTSSQKAEENILGESSNRVVLNAAKDYLHHIESLTKQSSRIIQIYSDDLPHVLFESQEIADAFSQFARGNRHSNIQILLKDTRVLIQSRIPLLLLNNRISAIKIRKADESYNFGDQTILLFDHTAIMEKPTPDSHAGLVCYSDRAKVRTQSQLFSEYWERSSEDPNIRDQLI
ncbi:MAG: hypothetical protein JKY01_11000 [Pseudomonadales bacterium]|nr:hypothetical protein [Pseudomonadales bacterium]